jgi:hypothetical protein
MAKVDKIVVHCSGDVATFGCVRVIRRWHHERGWRDIGYTLVILNGRPESTTKEPVPFLDGAIECGREFDFDDLIESDEVGAHALGHNATSVGICVIGRGSADFTEKQWTSLIDVCIDLCVRYGLKAEDVIGHYETDQAGSKTCPNIDMQIFREILKHVAAKRGITL